MDPAGERIKIASEKWVKEILTFMIGDGENYPGDQYDLFFSHYATHCVKDKQTTFENT